MSEPENFLQRWSRRKLENADDTKPAADESNIEARAPDKDAAPQDAEKPATEAPAPPALDLSKLPSLDSITGATDIRAFLQAGVPSELRDAALRRAWSADPNIRNYIGLSEYAWDFNDPNAMYGFGPMRPGDDIAKMLADIFSETPKPPVEQKLATANTQPAPPADDSAPANPPAQDQDEVPQEELENKSAPDTPSGTAEVETTTIVAVQNPSRIAEYDAPQPRRPHGRALPE